MPVPRYEVVLAGFNNTDIQQRPALAGSLTETQIAEFLRPNISYKNSDAVGSGVSHPSARQYVANTTWHTPLATRARELMEIFKVQRYIVTLRVGELDPLDPPIGEIVDLQNFSRLGFGSSKKFLCIGCRASLARNSLELTLWG